MGFSNKAMTVPVAELILATVVKARKKFGKQSSVPYTNDEIMDAIVVIDSIEDPEVDKLKAVIAEARDEIRKQAQQISGYKTQNTKLRRQIAELEAARDQVS